MTLLLDERLAVLRGVQRPRIERVPPYVATSGPEVVELAASAGLFLDPWQQHVLREGLGERADGSWAAFEVAVVVGRQNGKGGILEARELGGLFLLGEQLVIHSAHEFKTCSEHFLRVQSLIENTDALRKRCKKPRTSHGEEQIETLDGRRLKFLARSRGSGRGFSGDCVVLDEAFALDGRHMAALLPTLSAQVNPQVWYASSAGMDDSEHLRSIRARALA
jgi:phage terminase large subunit-like protein